MNVISDKGSRARVGTHREANVLLELQLAEPVTDEELVDSAERVLEALLAKASDLALGPALSLNGIERAMQLQFDLQAASDADAYEQVKRIVATAHRETGLELRQHSCRIEAWR